MLPGTARRYRVQWLLLGMGLLTLGAFIGYSLYLEYSRVDALERDRLQVQARVVEENLGRQLQGADDALAGVRNEFPPPVNKAVAKAASRHLKILSNAMPGVRTMLLVDADGTVLASSRDEFLGLSASGREYFTVPREHPDPVMLYVSAPFRTTLGVFSINVVRVLTGSRGEFAGIVSATLDPDYFNFVLRSVLYAPDMWVSIAHGDGVGFLYMPPNGQAAGIDLAKPGSFFSRHRESGQTASVMTGTVFATGEERMMAVRTIRPENVPMDKALVVGVSRDLSAIYARWRNDVFMTGAIYGVFVLTMILGLIFHQHRQLSLDRLEVSHETERKQAEEALRASEQRLDLALDSGRMGAWDLDLINDTAWRSLWHDRIFGYESLLPEWGYAIFLRHVVPEDRERVSHCFAEAMRTGQLVFECQITRSDRRRSWILARGQIYRDEKARPIRMLGTVMDITERKQAEYELRRKTELAQLLEQLARAANEAVSPEAAMDICLTRICEYGNWALGRVVRYGPARSRYKPEHSQWFCTEPARFGTFMQFSEEYEHNATTGRFVGRVLRDRVPVWLADLTVRDYSVPNRLGEAVKIGIKCAFAFPVIVGGDVVAILELLATETREPDALLIEGTTGLASQFARMIERSRATESQAKLGAIVEHSNDAIIGRAVDGTVTSWNAAAERILGYTAAEVVGRDAVEIVPPEDRQQIVANRILIRTGQSIPSRETVRIAKDGRRIDVAVSISPIRGNSGNIIGTATILRDVTERKQVEEILRESEDRYRDLVEHCQDLICTHDLDGRILSANPWAVKVLGYELAELVNMNLRDFLAPSVRHEIDGYLAAIRTQGAAQGLMLVQSRAGETRIWEYHNTLRTKGVATPVVRGMAHDITERKQAERELQYKTKLAELLEKLARAANEAASPEAAMETCLRRICEDRKWALGRVVTFRMKESRFKAERSQWFCTEPARFETFMRCTDGFDFKVDTGIFVGAAIREQRTVWLPDLAAIEKLKLGRLMMVVEAGLKAAFAFPVIVEGKVAAILEFFASETRPPDGLLIEGATGLASQFARMIERSRATESQAKLAAIVEHSNDAIVSFDLDHTILSWNVAAELLFGYSAAETVGRKSSLIIPADEVAQVAQIRERLKNGISPSVYDAVRLGKGGRRTEVAVSVSPIRDLSGEMVGVSTVYRDISDRKRAEETQARLAAIVEHSNDAIIGRTVDGTVTSWNAAAERILGYSAAEAIGRKMIEIHPPELHDEVDERRRRLVAGQQAATFESARITKDGRRIDVTLSASPIRDNSGNIVGTAAILRDITERKRIDKALHDSSRRLREMSQRLIGTEDAVRRKINRELHDRVGANVSALSLSFSMIMSKLSPESLRAVGTRLDDTQRLLDETITHIRDVMADLHPPALDDYGLHAALRAYAVAMSERVGVPITVQGEDVVPRLPLATETALFRVAQGGVANAVTHAHARRIGILLAASPDRMMLTVADDGVGFDVTQASLAHASWGLAIMRERAEAIGASLTVESAPGKGTRVCVVISRGGGDQ